MSPDPVRYAELRPHQFRARLAQRPIAYLPIGTLEWHGEQNPLGADALQAEGLMIQCAQRHGGIVMPPLYLGPDRAQIQPDGTHLYGMDYAAKVTDPPRQLDGSCYWVSQGLFLTLIDAILAQIKRAGFTTVFADGHGPSRASWCQNIEERQARYGLKLLGVTGDYAKAWRTQIDHAGRNETSITMALHPDLVDLTQLPQDRAIWPQGVGGQDPRDSTPQFGRECLEASIAVVGKMLEDAGV